jgi:phospholipase/carboxylesterase
MSDPLALEWSVVPRDGEPTRLMVLLHGYGEGTEDLAGRVDLIDPDGTSCVVMPLAPFRRRDRLNWHAPMASGIEAEEQLMASVAALDALLGELESELGLPADDALVGGFSQGGGLAYALLLGAEVRHRPAAGFGVCSFPPMVQGFAVDRAAASGRPCFLSSARQDHFAPIEMSRACAVVLRESGLDLTYVESDGGHEMTDEAATLIGRWVRSVDGGPRLGTEDLLADVPGAHPAFEGLWVDAG